MPNTPQGQIDLAIIGEKIDNLIEKVEKQSELFSNCKKGMEPRMRIIEDKMLTIEGKQKTSQSVLGAISIFLSAVAAYIGIRF